MRKERDELGGERYEKFSLPGGVSWLSTACPLPRHRCRLRWGMALAGLCLLSLAISMPVTRTADLLQGGRVNTSLLTALLVPDHTDPATAAEITEQSAGPRGGEQVPIQKQVWPAAVVPRHLLSSFIQGSL